MSDGMGRELVYLSSYATNRYFIPNWGNYLIKNFGFYPIEHSQVSVKHNLPSSNYFLSIAIFSNISFLHQIWRRTGARYNIRNCLLWAVYVTKFNYFKICKVYFWLMAPQCIEDSWAQIDLYMLFNQHDFTATFCISLKDKQYCCVFNYLHKEIKFPW